MPIDDPSIQLQAAIIAALKAASTAAGARVYDEVPDKAEFPYISLGQMQVLSEKAECVEGAELYVTIDAWSRSKAKSEILSIGKAIIATLDNAGLSGAGVDINCCELDDATYLTDPDGLTRHGVFTFHILTD